MEQLVAYIKSISNMSPTAAGALLAMFIAIVRALYDNKEAKTFRVFLEAMLCGSLSLAVSYGIEAAGLDPKYSVFLGGLIGYLGANKVRVLILKYIHKKSEN